MGEAKGDERMAFAIYIVGGTNTLGSSSRRSMRERTMIVSGMIISAAAETRFSSS
jgi:hypothetical protein